MDHDYKWLFSQPEKRIMVNMKNYLKGNNVFEATLKLDRQTLSLKKLIYQVFRFPFITLQIVLKIHLQAFKLWYKGATFYTHPNKLNK